MDNSTNLYENQIYAFSFPPTKNILYKLRNTDCSYITNPNNFSHYLKLLLHDQPKYILGLGSYSGVDQDKIRIETICTNQFRNEFEDGTQKQTSLTYFLQPNEYENTSEYRHPAKNKERKESSSSRQNNAMSYLFCIPNMLGHRSYINVTLITIATYSIPHALDQAS